MIVNKRREILFLYDIVNGNPNGDPFYENRPRIDKETGLCLVTDIRLKRTIRDYFFNNKGYDGKDDKDIFIRKIPHIDQDGRKKGIKDSKARAEDFGTTKDEITESITEKCIDVRLFGGVIPLVEDVITFLGPVQFRMGQSMHRVEVNFIKGVGGFASDIGYSSSSFRDEYIVPYALVCFYGIVNEHAAAQTNLQEEDLPLLYEGLWMGTKNLITRTKIGQNPRLMLIVTYKEPNYFVGELDKYINLETELSHEKIRDVSDYSIKMTRLANILEDRKDKIEKIEIVADNRFQVNDLDDLSVNPVYLEF